MIFTNEQLIKARSAKSAEELLAMAKEAGIEMTADEAAKYFAELNKHGELNETELAAVAGGSKDPQEYDVKASWAPCCNGKYQMREGENFSSLLSGDSCGKCIHFKYTGTLDILTNGKCRREFD